MSLLVCVMLLLYCDLTDLSSRFTKGYYCCYYYTTITFSCVNVVCVSMDAGQVSQTIRDRHTRHYHGQLVGRQMFRTRR